MTKLIPYGRQDISDADIAAVVATLKGDYLTQGPAVEQFEDALSAYLGSKYAVAVSNGTAGLHIAYLAAGIGPGDAVFVPAITFAATANAVLYCHAIPVIVDVNSSTGEICSQSLLRCVDIALRSGLKPKAIVPVHFAGLPCNMTEIIKIAKNYELLIIEDACHALGAEFRLKVKDNWQKIGSADWSSMSVFSFHPVKHITTGEGGAVTTNDYHLAEKLRSLRTHGITKNHERFTNTSRAYNGTLLNPWYHEMQSLGFNYRLCDIQASLGKSQLSRIDRMITRRRNIAEIYRRELSQLQDLQIPSTDVDTRLHSYHLFPVQIDYKLAGMTRAQFMGALKEQGIGSQVHYLPVPWHPYYEANKQAFLSDSLVGATAFYEKELSLPLFSAMTDDEVSKVIEVVRKILD